MRKHQYISLIAATAGILSLNVPLITSAQTTVDTGASVGIGASVDAGQNTDAPKLRDTLKQKIQQNYQAYSENVRNNEDYRNAVMEKKHPGIASTTIDASGRPMPMMLKARIEGGMDRSATSTRFASSTERREMRQDMREDIRAIRKDLFVQMRDRLVSELTHAFDNLKQIRTRISTRIDLEAQNGKDMTSAKALLVTADAKLTLADQAIQNLKTYVPTATTTVQANVSADVELDKPREIGREAIAAVNDARKALGDVIVAIAKALGTTITHE